MHNQAPLGHSFATPFYNSFFIGNFKEVTHRKGNARALWEVKLEMDGTIFFFSKATKESFNKEILRPNWNFKKGGAQDMISKIVFAF